MSAEVSLTRSACQVLPAMVPTMMPLPARRCIHHHSNSWKFGTMLVHNLSTAHPTLGTCHNVIPCCSTPVPL
jgi:hypothetical protein